MIKEFGQWLLAKQVNAGLVAFVCIMLTFIGLPTSLFANIIIAFVTLRKGSKFGFVTLLWVALPALAMLIRGHVSVFDLMWLRCVFIYALALVLRHTHCWNDVLAVLTIVGVIAVFAIHGFVPNVNQKWYLLANQFMHQWTAAGQTQPAEWQSIISIFAKMGTGIALCMMLIVIFIQLMLARLWQASMFNPGALRKEILQIRINRWVSLVLPVVIIVIAITHSVMLTDVFPVIIFPFMIAGFVVLHILAVATQKIGFLVPIAYILTCLFIYLACLWALLGFIDAWYLFPIRNRAFQLLKKGDK